VPKRVILISVDDLRYDALSCESDTRYLDRYGLAGLRSTPTLDALAARGARFGQAIAAAPYTPASHATMLTGQFPPAHGVRAFMTHRLNRDVATVAEGFLANGFHTVSAIDFGAMFTLLDLDRGFEDRFVADDTALVSHLESHAGEPLFCFIHLVDVHPPVGDSFCPPWDGYNDDFYAELQATANELGVTGRPLCLPGVDPEQSRREAVALSGRIRTWAEDRGIADLVELPRYLAGVNKFDQGRLRWLLDRLNGADLLRDTLLVLTSDHGQGRISARRMGDPSVPLKFDHGESLVEETIRVPLIMIGPGISPGSTVDAQVSLADVAPTLLDWAGIDPEPDIPGRTLLDALQGADPRDSTVYAEVWFHDRTALSRHLRRSVSCGSLTSDGYDTFLNQRVVRTPRYKYSRRGSALDADDWAANDAEFVRACHEKLLSRVVDPALAAEQVRQLRDGARTRDELARDLAARNPDREALYDLASDPYEQVNLVVLARALARQGRPHSATEIARELAATMDEIDGAVEDTEGRDRDPRDAAGPVEVRQDQDLALVEARLRDLGYIE
jgi:arylsulfatase A-like enzyme